MQLNSGTERQIWIVFGILWGLLGAYVVFNPVPFLLFFPRKRAVVMLFRLVGVILTIGGIYIAFHKGRT